MSACSSGSKKKRGDLSVNVGQDMNVLLPNGEGVEIKKGDSYSLSNSSALFEKPGHVSVLVVPLKADKGNVDLKLKPIQEFGGAALDRYIDVYLTGLMTKVTQVQETMASKNYSLALQKIKGLQIEYPNLVYLQFLEASCLTLMGEKPEAQRVLTRALEVHPNNPEGQRLNRYLSGGR